MDEKRYGILIASSQFSKESGLRPLRCPESDVDGLKEILDSSLYGKFEIEVVKNEPSHEILTKIEDILTKGDKDDLYLIYYSGHGKLDSSGNLYLAAPNTIKNKLKTTAVKAREIVDIIDEHTLKKSILILDCCYSGAITKSAVDDELKRISKVRGTYILTASTDIQVAIEKPEDKYSLLTKHIIEGIKTGKASQGGLVTIHSLYGYVHESVMSEGSQEPTLQEISGRGADLVIANIGQLSPSVFRKTILNLLIEYRDDIPKKIRSVVDDLIDLDKDNLTEDKKVFYTLLEGFAQRQSDVAEFVRDWEAIENKKSKIAEEFDKSKIAIDSEEWEKAINLLKEVLRLDPNHTQAVKNLGFAQQQLNLANLYAEGIKAFELSKFGDAIAYFQEITKIDNNYRDVSKRLKKVKAEQAKFIQQGEESKAQEELRKELERKQNELKLKYEEGQRYFSEEKWNEALKAFRELRNQKTDYRDIDNKIELSSIFLDAQTAIEKRSLNLLIKSLTQLQKKAIPSDISTKYIKTITNQVNILLGLRYLEGKKFFNEGNYKSAIEHFRKIQDFYPDYIYKDTAELLNKARNKLNEKSYSRLDIAEAKKVSAKATDLYRRGLNSLMKMRYVEAIENLEKALDILPNDQKIISELANVKKQQKIKTLYESGKSRFEAKDWQQAIEYFSEVEELYPDYSDVRELIEIAKRSGRLSIAEQTWRFASKAKKVLFVAASVISIIMLPIMIVLLLIIGQNPQPANNNNTLKTPIPFPTYDYRPINRRF